MMNEMNTFACQFATGEVYPNGHGMGFIVNKGMTCLDAGSPKDTFDRLMHHYNSKEAANKLVSNGDMIKMSYSVETSQYELDDAGERVGKEFTCVEDSLQYKDLLGMVPCVFLYCTVSETWFFFSFQLNRVTGEGVIKPHVVSNLVNTITVGANQLSMSTPTKEELVF